MRLQINKGDKFSYFEVLGEGERLRLPSGQINRTIKCKCICGKVKDIRLLHLKRGRIKSCGCISKTMNGLSTTDIGRTYRAMTYRCSENYFEKHLYHERGINVCDEWLEDFMSFYHWAKKNGHSKDLQLDRIDNNKGYSPDNCRFVSSKVNVNNRRNTIKVEYNGEKISLQLLLEELDYPNKYCTVRTRILRGWDVKEAIFTPPKDNYKNQTKKLKSEL